MEHWVRTYAAIVVCALLALLGYNVICWGKLQASDWASWAQAIGTVGAIAVAVHVSRKQIIAERGARNEAVIMEAATTILSLQVMANELARMCVLSFYQKQDPEKHVIYSNPAGEFEAMASMFRDFPISVLAGQGEVGKLLQLRRIALEMSDILRSDPDLPGEQFVRRHRNRHHELVRSARRMSELLAEAVERVAPGKFTNEIVHHL